MRTAWRRAGACVLVAAMACATLGIGLPVPSASAEDEGSTGTLFGTGSISQLTQQVQQLTQAVQQITQYIGGIYQSAARTLFGGIPGTLPAVFSNGVTSIFSAATWLQQLSSLIQNSIARSQSTVASEWGSEWGMAPDYTYSSQNVAQQLENIAGSVGGSASQWVSAISHNLAAAPAPQPGTPQASATVLSGQSQDFAARSHALQQSQVSAIATQANAQSAAEQAQQVALQATQDTTPQQDAEASSGVSRQAGVALETAPSTRAAVEVMGAAITQQQAYQQATLAAIASRLDALLTQQAQVALILSQAVAATGTASGLIAQQLEQQLEDQAQAAATHRQAQLGAISGVSGELQYLSQAPRDGTLDTFLTDLGGLR